MNYVFKAFFDESEDAEAAYYILRNKKLVTDISMPNLNIPVNGKIKYTKNGHEKYTRIRHYKGAMFATKYTT